MMYGPIAVNLALASGVRLNLVVSVVIDPVLDILTSDGTISNIVHDTETGVVTFTLSGAAEFNGTHSVDYADLVAGKPTPVIQPSGTLESSPDRFDVNWGLWVSPDDDQALFTSVILRGDQVIATDEDTSYILTADDEMRDLNLRVTAQNIAGSTVVEVPLQVGLSFTQKGVYVDATAFERTGGAPLIIPTRQSAAIMVSHNNVTGSLRNLMLVGTTPADWLYPMQLRRDSIRDTFVFTSGGVSKRDFGADMSAHSQVTTICEVTAQGGPIRMWSSGGGNFEQGNQDLYTDPGMTDIDLTNLLFSFAHVQYVGNLYRGALWLTDRAMPDWSSDSVRDRFVNSDGSLVHPDFSYGILGDEASGELLFDFHGDAADMSALNYSGVFKAQNALTLRPFGTLTDAT